MIKLFNKKWIKWQYIPMLFSDLMEQGIINSKWLNLKEIIYSKKIIFVLKTDYLTPRIVFKSSDCYECVEFPYLSPLSGSECIQPVHNLRGHVSSQSKQLRWAVLWSGSHASGVRQLVFHGLVSFNGSRSSQCSTTGVTKAVVCAILSVGWCI